MYDKLKNIVKSVLKIKPKKNDQRREENLGKLENLPVDIESQPASDEIKKMVSTGCPMMVARLGANELSAVINYKYINETTIEKKVNNFIRYEKIWWWSEHHYQSLYTNAGFFPYSARNMDMFSELMISSMRNVDILGSWLPGENLFKDELSQAKICRLQDLEPYYHEHPWSVALKDKNVLVVHPFAESIKNQYSVYRSKLFKNPDVLPQFNLIVFKSVQSIAGNQTRFNSWFEALDWMTDEIKRINFDVAIIGCGAYGFPLAARIKDLGKQAIHLGGATQILFGIKGKRWDTHPIISHFYNSYWTRPKPEEIPENANKVENSCYW